MQGLLLTEEQRQRMQQGVPSGQLPPMPAPAPMPQQPPQAPQGGGNDVTRLLRRVGKFGDSVVDTFTGKRGDDLAAETGRVQGELARRQREAEQNAKLQQMLLKGGTQGPRGEKTATRDAEGNPIWMFTDHFGRPTGETLPRDVAPQPYKEVDRYNKDYTEQWQINPYTGQEIPGTRRPTSPQEAAIRAAAIEEVPDKLSQSELREITMIQGIGDDLTKIGTVLGDLSTAKRGPVAGRASEKNPYDVPVQRLENLIDGITPLLARGVFGEVGVLTNSDMARYRKQLPAARQDPEVAKAIFADLKDKIQQSYARVIRNYGNAGRDVSGFDPNKNLFGGSQAESQGGTVRLRYQDGKVYEVDASKVEQAVGSGMWERVSQ